MTTMLRMLTARLSRPASLVLLRQTPIIRQQSTLAKFSKWGQANPITLGVGVATLKTALADIIVQKAVERREDLDMTRVGLFTVFGFAYMGCFQYFMYCHCFAKWFKHAATFANQPWKEKMANRLGQIDCVKQVVFDVLIHPIWFFPLYYSTKEIIQGKGHSVPDKIGDAMAKYKKNAWEDWTSFWKIWIPTDIVIYMCPMWLRLPANHSVSFLYVCILSFMRGAPDPPAKDSKESAQ